MNNGDALKALQEYYDIKNPTPDDEFKFTEALGYLIEETKDPKYMTELGWYYASRKRFDLEIKYLEMAAEYELRDEELNYHAKKLRIRTMDAALTDNISFELWDDKKLEKKIAEYVSKDYPVEKMLEPKSVVRPN